MHGPDHAGVHAELRAYDLTWPHEPGDPMGWETVDPDIRRYVLDVVASMRERLAASGIVGAYLHGSLATNSFYRGKSDIDMILVVEARMSASARRAVAVELVRLSDHRPIAGDIEVMVHRRADVSEFTPAVRFEVRYREADEAAIASGHYDHVVDGTVPDAAADLFAVGRTGLVLVGEPVADVFGSVPSSAFEEAVREDVDWILSDENILTTPIYGILNCCRWFANQAQGWTQPVSKDAAGTWGLDNLPAEHRPTIAQAICCHRSREAVPSGERKTDGHAWDRERVLAFRDHVRAHIAR